MEFYAERFRALFRELGDNVTNLGSQVGDVSQQVADWLRSRGGRRRAARARRLGRLRPGSAAELEDSSDNGGRPRRAPEARRERQRRLSKADRESAAGSNSQSMTNRGSRL